MCVLRLCVYVWDPFCWSSALLSFRDVGELQAKWWHSKSAENAIVHYALIHTYIYRHRVQQNQRTDIPKSSTNYIYCARARSRAHITHQIGTNCFCARVCDCVCKPQKTWWFDVCGCCLSDNLVVGESPENAWVGWFCADLSVRFPTGGCWRLHAGTHCNYPVGGLCLWWNEIVL